jgi:hypothetical protein
MVHLHDRVSACRSIDAAESGNVAGEKKTRRTRGRVQCGPCADLVGDIGEILATMEDQHQLFVKGEVSLREQILYLD